MKLINVENGKEKVYVQYQDLMEIINGEMGEDGFPAFIMDNLFADGQPLFISNHNRWNFVEFDTPEAVKYFKEQTWILDIKSVRGLSFDELREYGSEVAQKHDDIARKLQVLPKSELKDHMDEIKEYKAYEKIFYILPELSHTLRGFQTMGFPVVVDSDGYDCGSNEEYEAKSSLDPNKIIIRRKDGQPLNKGKVRRSYIKEVVANGNVAMSEARATYCTIGRAKHSITDDGMAIVITYKPNPILMEEEKEMAKEDSFVNKLKRKFSGQ